MSEKPIIYNGQMVRAILANPPRKSQTRRVIKYSDGGRPTHPDDIEDGWPVAYFEARNEYDFLPCPYGQPGDRLWVRETFAHVPEHDCVYYRADDPTDHPTDGSWTPSIHMPRWASRITLEITGIRVERVQDISPQDAIDEGVLPPGPPPSPRELDYAVEQFRELWDSINAKRGFGWDVNPYVWVIEFKVVERRSA